MEATQISKELKPLESKRKVFHFRDAVDDLWTGVKNWRVWLLLGWLDLRLRYRRSYLGPFWITISMTVMIYSMGFIYSSIFKVNLADYFLYISGGILAWILFSTTILEMMNCFVDATSFILQIKMPFSVYILRIMTRNFIVFGHNAIAVIPLLIFFKCMPNFLMLIFALFITAFSMLSIGMILAMLGARFRDVQQVIASVLQVGFLLTPIMWKPSMIPERAIFAAYLNPFYYYIELMRSAVMNYALDPIVIRGSLVIAFGGLLIMLLIFSKMRHRIPFWV